MFINVYVFSHFSLYLRFSSQVPGITWIYFISLSAGERVSFVTTEELEEEKTLLWLLPESCALTGSNEKPKERGPRENQSLLYRDVVSTQCDDTG